MNTKGYYKWLLKELNIDLNDFYYDDLFWHLLNRNFTWSVRNDDNRAGDGIELRHRYLRSGGALQEKEMKEPCSILEMLAALSIRCDREILGDPDVDKSDKLLWVMLENLGLDVYDDSYYDPEEVDDILDIWLLRRFDKYGNGGIFPVTKVGRDQRKVEIWFQMNDYLNENFSYDW
ncbi:MAG: hypothetical protein J6U54_05210 [Clostridiales bacterium]|nr:hypothetical protein [Clostridiales bacterium]